MAGFTLIELLVSMIIGSIIVVALLGLVVELTEVNQKDLSRTETQREMQAAIDYITQDLREAVFVYSGECMGNVTIGDPATVLTTPFCPGVLNHVPAALTAKNRVPVLVFWRTDPLPEEVLLKGVCAEVFKDGLLKDDEKAKVNNVPCIAGKGYNLVIYAIQKDDPNDEWKGKARLVRYQLSQYNAAGNLNDGYVDPVQSDELGNLKFLHWPYQKNKTGNLEIKQSVRPSGEGEIRVLVDFVDDFAIKPGGSPLADGRQPPACIPPPSVDKEIVPPNSATFNPDHLRGFYACVKGKSLEEKDSVAGDKQEIVVSLAGNVTGRPGFPTGNDNAARLSPLQTRVLSRGVVR
jgi:prepilin-type N-terminal cleavage/methylation domain-containing protein